MLKILRILVPIDFSKESDLALDWAVMVAGRNRGATLYLLHVLPPKPSGFGTVGYQKEQESMEKKLMEVQSRIPRDIISFGIVQQGEVPHHVAQLCSEKDIDLVVMTTRGRQGLKHFLPGSLTEDTVRIAPCPVLVLHLNAKNKPRQESA